jgi:L-asparaginase II
LVSGRFSLLARTLRGRYTQNWHFGAAAIVTPQGRLVARIGGVGVRAFIRSSAKPFQLLPLLLAGGSRQFGLSDGETALMCASHGGEDIHCEGVLRLLRKGRFEMDDLECGVHEPLSVSAGEKLRLQGRSPTQLHNNCSGQHAGSLLTCRLLRLSPAGYVLPDHPLQQRISEQVAQFSGVAPGEMEVAADGCGMPTFRLPLWALAWAYARLADPVAGGINGDRRRAVDQILNAMASAPEMVAGPGRFTTELMRATRGRLVGKEGAEGYYAVAIRGPVPLGLALKIADGTELCRDSVVLDILRQLGSLSRAEFESLAGFHRPLLRNHGGDAVGEIVTEIELVDSKGIGVGC